VIGDYQRITVPLVARPGVRFVERRTDKSCTGCGKQIEGGVAYLPERTGPRHLGCPKGGRRFG
jgi:hypothetical protein